MKLKSKMLLWIGAPLVVIFTAMAVFSYWEASNMIEEATEREMRALSEFHAEEVNRVVEAPKGILEGIGRVWSTNIPTDERFLETARDFTARPDIDSIYMGFPRETNRPFLYSEEGVVPLNEFDATSRPWYKLAESKEGVQLNEVSTNERTGKPTLAMSRAIRHEGQLLAVMGLETNFSDIQNIVAKIKIREHGAAFLLDEQGRFIYHSALGLDDNVHAQGEEDARRLLSKEPIFFTNTYAGVENYYAVHPVGTTGWSLVLFVPKDEVLADVNNLKWTMIVGLLVSLALIGGLLYKIADSIAGPLENMAGAAQEVAKGNLAIVPPQMDRDDEIGQLHNSLLTMVKNLRELIQKTAQTSEQLAASSEELTASADQSAQGAQSAAEAIVKITGSTIEQNEVVDQSFKTVDGITHAINEITMGISDVSAATHRAETATVEGQQGLGVAVKGMDVLNQSAQDVSDAVTALYESSKRISEIVEMITEIAGQTNLLALNAAIEAARAGEAGRGFAVVAEEVRKLAEQSSAATNEIEQTIGRMIESIQVAAGAISNAEEKVDASKEVTVETEKSFNSIQKRLEDVRASITQISKAVDETAGDMQAVVGNVQSIGTVAEKTGANAENVAAASEEQSASLHDVSDSAESLSHTASKLNDITSKFKL